jgi:hypothetical protein
MNLEKIFSYKKNYHYLFLFILSLNYLIPLIVFGKITLFYPDALEIEVVYNKFIGEFAKGNFNSIDIMSGHLKWDYLRRLFSPIYYLYALNNELAYWLVDIILKITAYISFFTLAKKISKNNLLVGLLACLFASTTDQTHLGFGLAISPYLIYLITFKEQIKLKHYLIIIFFGLNADLMTTIWLMPFICLISDFLNKKILDDKKIHIIKILSIFNIFLFLASANLIYTSLFGEALHREEYVRTGIPFFENLIIAFIQLFRIPNNFDLQLFHNIQYMIILIPGIIISLIWRNRISPKFLILIASIVIILFFLRSESFVNFQNSSQGLFKTTNFNYIESCLPLLYVIFLLHLCNIKKNFNLMIVPISISLIIFQIDTSIVPFTKTYLLKNKSEYKNLYTFKGYYSYDEYLEIKKIVKDKRTISVGLNPMVAAMNDIKTIDGYFTVYPLSYKKKYRKIIEDEIENNIFLKDSFDSWGNRVMIYFSPNENPNENKIKFTEAKKIGVDYVISKYKLKNKDLELVKTISKNLYLLKIL